MMKRFLSKLKKLFEFTLNGTFKQTGETYRYDYFENKKKSSQNSNKIVKTVSDGERKEWENGRKLYVFYKVGNILTFRSLYTIQFLSPSLFLPSQLATT